MEVHLLYYVSCDAVWGGLCESVLLTVLQLSSRWCCITYTGRMLMYNQKQLNAWRLDGPQP